MGQAEDGFALRHNPLGIHSFDGADIVLGKAPRHPAAASVYSDVGEVGMKALRAKSSFYDPHEDDSVPTGELSEKDQFTDDPSNNMLSELGISSGPSSNDALANGSASSVNGNGFANLDFGNDFSTDFTADLHGMLSRKRTITARPMPPSESTPTGLADLKTKTGPSRNPLLIQRLKSIRKQLNNDQTESNDYEDDVKRAEGLPDDVLKMIAFSPDSPWLEADSENEQDDSADSYDEIPPRSPLRPSAIRPSSELEQSQQDTEEPNQHPFFGKTPLELNPFYSAKMKRDIQENISPSVTTLASSISENEDDAFSPKESDVEQPVAQDAAEKKKVVLPPPIEETDPVAEDDRGRLFLQINKIANLRGLPIDVPRNPKFTLSLDNGLQTVTTESMPLPAPGFSGNLSAKIGQEFELTVAKDLELVLTVGVSMDAVKPPPRPTAPPRGYRHEAQKSTSSTGSSMSTSSTGGSPIRSMKNLLLRSPRKKQQARFQEREEEERQRRIKQEEEEEERSRAQHERDLKDFYQRADIWRHIVGPRGEFCRGYVFESHYEKDIFGKARSFAIPLYNEWDKSTDGVPKPVCELQVTMMYVPKLYGSEQIPMSMQQCQKELEAARKKRRSGCEGFLTQQGGDCGSMWRRRYFTLSGTELVGHHEATKKRRTLIHLEKAVAVKDTLSDDLWCIYEDRSFQISFEDGEAISFYADTVEARNLWLKALNDSVANSTGQHRSWTDLVFEAQDGEAGRLP